MHRSVQVSSPCFPISWVYIYPEVAWLDRMVILCLISQGPAILSAARILNREAEILGQMATGAEAGSLRVGKHGGEAAGLGAVLASQREEEAECEGAEKICRGAGSKIQGRAKEEK